MFEPTPGDRLNCWKTYKFPKCDQSWDLFPVLLYGFYHGTENGTMVKRSVRWVAIDL